MFSIENQNDNILNGNGLNNTILQTNSLFIPELKNTDTKTTLIVGKTDLSNDDILILSTWDYWFKNQEKYRPSSLDLLGLSSELCALCFLGRAIVKLAHTENSPLIIHVGNEIRMIRKHNKYNKWESNEELTWAEYLKKTYEEEKMNIINNMNDMECQSQDLENIINENSSQQRKLKDIIHIISALASITTQENQIILLKIFLERISLVSNILPVDYQNEIITARAVLELCSQNVTSLPNPKNITQILFKVGNSISMDHVQSFDLFVISYSLLSQYIYIKFNNEWMTQININFSRNKHFYKKFKFFIDNCLTATNEADYFENNGINMGVIKQLKEYGIMSYILSSNYGNMKKPSKLDIINYLLEISPKFTNTDIILIYEVINVIKAYQLPEDISSSLITIALFSSFTGICFLFIASIFCKFGYTIDNNTKFKSSFFNKDLIQKSVYNTCYNYLISVHFDISIFNNRLL
ncbi:hypothetical protein LY90DRAFT_668240 [Neocallimastix californiae]|uniref:Uncharacterized protein n=1 Tax=Neocallimastix californiae TaxID=1754190 RepID=A0A1Y2DWX0_9FUNG|nr:hypothetical protein LY90DRAFT_668240 [Neocallimastix californiae]|eukprot:ORY63771.1 hypothetical protein LY90DRAFT_668240 [Neocallimastix californiae]